MTKDKNHRDVLYGEFINQIHETKDDLRKLIDDCVKKQEQQIELKHYATKSLVLSWGVALTVGLCTAYMYITPHIIRSENSSSTIAISKEEIAKNQIIQEK